MVGDGTAGAPRPVPAGPRCRVERGQHIGDPGHVQPPVVPDAAAHIVGDDPGHALVGVAVFRGSGNRQRLERRCGSHVGSGHCNRGAAPVPIVLAYARTGGRGGTRDLRLRPDHRPAVGERPAYSCVRVMRTVRPAQARRAPRAVMAILTECTSRTAEGIARILSRGGRAGQILRAAPCTCGLTARRPKLAFTVAR